MSGYEKIVIASNNKGKIKEFHDLLNPRGITVVPQQELGVKGAYEPHMTFVENALVKARHVSRYTRFPVLADDSGICVESLNGQPGVRSSRFARESATDQENNLFLIEQLSGQRERGAHYYCVIVVVSGYKDPAPLLATGKWEGEILGAPRGSFGFGYDPLFYDSNLGKTAAELNKHQKNKVSHRGIAIRKIIKLLEK